MRIRAGEKLNVRVLSLPLPQKSKKKIFFRSTMQELFLGEVILVFIHGLHGKKVKIHSTLSLRSLLGTSKEVAHLYLLEKIFLIVDGMTMNQKSCLKSQAPKLELLFKK